LSNAIPINLLIEDSFDKAWVTV